MSAALTTIVIVLAAAVIVLALVDIVRDRDPGWATFAALTLLEVGLLVQAVVGLVELSRTGRDVNGVTFSAYLVGALVILPAAFLWAATERSRWGTAVIVVGALAVIALEYRLHQIWYDAPLHDALRGFGHLGGSRG